MLTLRPTWPRPGNDWTVFDDGAEVGRIYEDNTARVPHVRWFWTLGGEAGRAFQLGIIGIGRAPNLEDAKAGLRAAYEQWLARRDSLARPQKDQSNNGA
jgi:hypothetical protein